VEVRRWLGDGQETLFVFNHSYGAAVATVAVRLPWSVRKARELENDQPVRFDSNAGRTIFHKRLAAGEIWVLSMAGL